MIDPLISLAFAVQSSPGTYSLLIGSGVSRAAGIPTGWEVVLDLAQQVAELEGADTSGDVEAWFRERFDQELNYSELLEQIARSPEDRNQLLRSYFEPTEEEREQGLKVPTTAHRAVAQLVRDGYLRVILTTNFDRLLELALEDDGIVPAVIASPDAAEGALPLANTACTVVKLHGDYRDARILNTPTELASYDPRIDRILDRVLDEYGLVICGWSGEYDIALGDAILRAPSRRFQTFWAAREALGARAQTLFDHRGAQLIRIDDASTFFVELAEKVVSLAELRTSHPVSPKVAVATLKRYLPDEQHRIRLHDLLADELTRLEQATDEAAFPRQEGDVNHDTLVARLERYEAASETVIALMATLGYWAEPAQRHLITGALERLARPAGEVQGGYTVWLNLRLYPTLLAFYAAGLGAVARGELATLASIFGEFRIERPGDTSAVVDALGPGVVVEGDLLNLPGGQRYYTPVQNRLHAVLREPLRELVPDDERYEDIFDRFEVLFAVACAHVTRDSGFEPWSPPGRYVWRRRGTALDWAREQVEGQVNQWPFLSGPLFGGNVQHFRDALDAVTNQAGRMGWH